MSDLQIAILVCSTRSERVSDQVASWVIQHAQADSSNFELVDLRNFKLPNLGETPNDKALWDSTLDRFDAFIFVTPEYNHSVPGVLKNALDITREPLANKAAAIVSYGSSGGVRAAEHLRLILAELEVATVRTNLTFSRQLDFDGNRFTPNTAAKTADLQLMLDQLQNWASALKTIR